MTDLHGKVVVVTGAGGAAGPAVVAALHAHGATVIAADATPESLTQFAHTAESAVIDLLDETHTFAWAKQVHERHGRIDGLIHLVGGWRGGQQFSEQSLEDWDFLEQRLVRTLHCCTRAFHPMLGASEAGRCVIISAKAASVPSGSGACYAAAKAAAQAWMLALAHSWRESTTAAASILVVNGLLTERMRADNPDKPYRTMTHVDTVAAKIVSLWDVPATQVNGELLWLIP